MSQVAEQSPTVDIDALLQDSYLLVVALQHNAAAKDGAALWQHCATQVERCRNHLIEAGVNPLRVEQIGYAQCALLDETVLRHADSHTHGIWVAKPLQAHFFNRHQAGEQLCDDMRDALAQAEPDLLLLTCYQRLLMLGFLGRYRDEKAAEREQLLSALNEQVKPFAAGGVTPILVAASGGCWRRWLNQPWLHLTTAALLLAGLWLLLHRLLGASVAAVLLAQVP